MRHLIILFIPLLLLSCGNSKQEEKEEKNVNISLTDDTILKNEEGKEIPLSEFQKAFMSGDYTVDPIMKDGKTAEAKLRKLPEEKRRKMKSKGIQKAVEVNSSAPLFEVTDIHGTTYNLEDLKDKIVVLNFWFVQCKPCIMEIPELNELVEANKDVVFIAMAKSSKKEIKDFKTRHEFNYNIIPEAYDIVSRYQVSSFPTSIVIKNGVIQYRGEAYSSSTKEEIQHAIDGKEYKKQTEDPNSPKKGISLNSDSDIRNESGKKLEMMEAVQMINSQKYIFEEKKDENGVEYILLKEKK